MTMLNIHLLGAPSVFMGTTPVTHFRSAKVLALLAYLTVEAGSPHQREALATLLWPDYPSSTALRNLSQTLTRLRRALDDLSGTSAFFEITPHALCLNQSELVTCDIWRLDGLLKCCESHEHVALERCLECQSRLDSAAGLARGELLDGFTVGDSEVFEEWLLLAREFWHERQLSVLDSAATGALALGRYGAAIGYAHRQLALEPWREAAHQHLMRTLALEGQRAAALAQFERCRRVLAEELGVEPARATRELYEHIRDGALAPAAATPVLVGAEDRASRGSTLPNPLTQFFGREEELEALGAQLREGAYRVLTIYGPGGIGKTRLALEVARRQRPLFAGGVFFVPLAAVERPDDVPTAIARALQLQPSDRTSSLEHVLHFLSERHTLVLLDNIEHLLPDVVSWIIRMAEQAPGVRFLVTSRERLNVMAEDLYPLGGLPVPLLGARVASVVMAASVRLFVDRARRLDKSFVLDESNEQDIIRICSFLEGLPLGIELAATWIGEMDCRRIAESIRTNLNFLSVEARDLHPQHRSLRAVFDHSWRLLSAQEQLMLSRLSVFRGGFTRCAAEQIAGATPLQINHLRHKSLVRLVGADRLALHELIRLFAREQLHSRPHEEALTLQRHATWYLDFLAERRARLYQEDAHGAVAEILADLDNVRAAWQHAAQPDGGALWDMAIQALGRFYRLVGYHEEGISLFGEAAQRFRAALQLSTSADDSLHLILSRLLLEQVSCCLGRAEARVELLRALDEAKGLAHAANASFHLLQGRVLEGRVYRLLGRIQEAAAILRQVLVALSEHAFPFLTSETHFELGRIFALRNRLVESTAQYREALTVQRASKNRIEEQQTLLYLAVNAIWQLDYMQGLSYLEQATTLTVASVSPATQMRIANALGFIESSLGNYERALARHEECHRLADQLGDLAQESHAFHNLCFIHTMTGDLDAALETGRTAVNLAQRSKLPEPKAYASMHLGFARLARGEWDTAEAALTHAWQLWRAQDCQPLLTEVLAGLAQLALLHQDVSRANHYASAVSTHLMRHGVSGIDAPFRTYLLCYEVLNAIGRIQDAQRVLWKGYAELQAVAAKISTPETRVSFLNNVPPNHALLQACSNNLRPHVEASAGFLAPH